MTATLVLAGMAIWSAATPYIARAVGWEVPVPDVVEVVDHVVPGALALSAALGLGRPGRSGLRDPDLRLLAVGVAVLSGVWVAASHAPLVLDASRGAVGWGGALLHARAGPLLLAPALMLLAAEIRAR